MGTKKFTQFGTFSVSVMLPFFLLSIIMIFIIGSNHLIGLLILSFTGLTFLICLLIFYKLTIYIDSTYISFKLGLGLINKKYLISDVKSCKSVKNDPFYGIGIRKIPNGWLYNVTGLEAIELTFKNRNSKIRIGTNKPNEIVEILSKLIVNEPGNPTYDTGKSSFSLFWSILIFVLIVPIILIAYGNKEPTINMTKTDFKIKCAYGMTIKYSDIIQIDTIPALPRLKLKTNGYAFAKTYKGNFRLQDQVNAKLFIKGGFPPYIFIKTDKINLYINFRNPAKTLDLFDDIVANQKNIKQ